MATFYMHPVHPAEGFGVYACDAAEDAHGYLYQEQVQVMSGYPLTSDEHPMTAELCPVLFALPCEQPLNGWACGDASFYDNAQIMVQHAQPPMPAALAQRGRKGRGRTALAPAAEKPERGTQADLQRRAPSGIGVVASKATIETMSLRSTEPPTPEASSSDGFCLAPSSSGSRWADMSDEDETPSTQDAKPEGCASSGSRGHPFNCAPPCKYSWRGRGCKEGSSCSRCHLCRWSNAAERAHQQALAKPMWKPSP